MTEELEAERIGAKLVLEFFSIYLRKIYSFFHSSHVLTLSKSSFNLKFSYCIVIEFIALQEIHLSFVKFENYKKF